MYKSEPRSNPTLINHVIMVMNSKRRLLGLIRVLTPLKFKSKVDSIFH